MTITTLPPVPPIEPLVTRVDQLLTDLTAAVEQLQQACWGPDDHPNAALPRDWHRTARKDLQALIALLDSTPTPESVACGGDYDQ